MAGRVVEYKLYKTKQTASKKSFYALVRPVTSSTDDGQLDSLWFDRTTGELQLRKISSTDDLEFMFVVYGFIGKFQINSNCHSKLVFIKEIDFVGSLHAKSLAHDVYKLKQIVVLTLSPESSQAQANDDTDSVASMELETFQATKDQGVASASSLIGNLLGVQSAESKSASLSPNQLSVPNAASPMSPANNTSSLGSVPGSPSGSSNVARIERKIIDEIQKLFQENGGGSFYLSHTFDLTNSVERQEELFHAEADEASGQEETRRSRWRKADERFFWNRIMLSDLIDLDNEDPDRRRLVDTFVLPLIQGFVQMDSFRIKLTGQPFQAAKHSSSANKNKPKLVSSSSSSSEDEYADLRLALVARRSRYRLGTRFKRRGIDEQGNVANFVETEQIVNVYGGHTLSFVIVRGSIPLFWSQSGVKYRPAPRIDKTASENKTALRKHFEDLSSRYPNQRQIVVVNLVEETGKESLLGNAYLENLAEIDLENPIAYVQFDFHEHCKGLKFENVSVLIDKIHDLISDYAYCWVDKRGIIFKQKHLFRVNCVDCLDRTNVVQMVIAKNALENQLAKLGLVVPSESRVVDLPVELKKQFLSLWANMGDAISQQYAGTSALKGDYTRTGERNLAGIMKDGMTSANRYYLRFRDTYRQLAIDVLQGVMVSDEELLLQTNSSSSSQLKSTASVGGPDDQKNSSARDEALQDEVALISQSEREENVKQLVADCRKQLIDVSEDCYGSWALINYNESSDASQIDPDVVLLFTSSALYVSNYDDSSETFVDYQKISLQDVEKFELGPEPAPSQTLFFKNSSAPRFHLLRIHYRIPINSSSSLADQSSSEPASSPPTESCGYFHTFRSCNLRFFNNLVITTKSADEMTEALRGICHTIQSTALYFNHTIEFEEVAKVVKKRSKTPNNLIKLSKLRTRMSIVSQPATSNNKSNKSQLSDAFKLNKIGKLIGNKILDLTKKTSVFKPMSIEAASINSSVSDVGRLTSADSNELSKQEFEPSTFYLDEGASADCPSGIEVSKTSEAETSVGQGLVSFVGSLMPTSQSQINKAATTTSLSATAYVPKLSQRDFANRQEKLHQTSQLIKDSKIKFIFI